jgi:hypothetical protein
VSQLVLQGKDSVPDSAYRVSTGIEAARTAADHTPAIKSASGDA